MRPVYAFDGNFSSIRRDIHLESGKILTSRCLGAYFLGRPVVRLRGSVCGPLELLASKGVTLAVGLLVH